MKSAALWCALALPGIAAGARPSAIEVLHQTASAYRNLHSYQFRVTVQTIRDASSPAMRDAKVAVRTVTETGAQNRFRIDQDDSVRVSDGATEYNFPPAAHQYTQHPAASDPPTSAAAFAQIDQHVKTASIAREEQFALNGKPVPVYVVRVVRDTWRETDLPGASFAMYRIDQKTFQVYKVITYSKLETEIRLYSILKWNGPVDESRFAFHPASSARLVSALSTAAPEGKAIVGSEAPAFTLQDGAGRPVHLADFRGKVVIVDFWATWCGPCQALMPHLEKLHREYGDQGLVILGLDAGEDAGTVAKFAQEKGYTFRLLLGAEPDVSGRYFVEGYPTTFVIDRNGRILFREVGGGTPAELRSAVESALRAKS